jgi:hypothetical protein
MMWPSNNRIPFNFVLRFIGARGIALLILSSLTASAAAAGYKGEFIPFPDASFHFNDRGAGNLAQHGSDASVDFFYAAKYLDWRLLSEIVISNDERDLERFVIGRVTPNGYQMWIGSDHTALGQWNYKFHHGAYLQPSIHRPGIIEWEDEGGVIPAHITGINVGGDREAKNRIINFTMELGLGPSLSRQGKLIAYNLLDHGDGNHDLAVIAKLSGYDEDDAFDDSGLFAGYIIIPSDSANIHEVRQSVLGAYTNYTMNAILWRTSFFYVANSLEITGNSNKNESFGYAYIEPEYTFNTIWTFYGRWEQSFGAQHDLYIQQIPAFITERTLVGARYQLIGSQALKLELSDLEQFSQRFAAVELQWSAAMP